MHFQVQFENPIDQELVAELEKGAVYATARLTRFRITADRRAADIECIEGARDEVTEKVRKYVEAMVARFRSLGEPEELARTVRRDESTPFLCRSPSPGSSSGGGGCGRSEKAKWASQEARSR